MLRISSGNWSGWRQADCRRRLTPKPARSPWREHGARIVAAALIGGLLFLAGAYWRNRPEGEVARFAIHPPEKTAFSGPFSASVATPQFALSPDGRAIAFVAAAIGAKPMLWLRAVDEVDARPLSGTEDGTQPFWSPDSRWIGFFAEGKLKKIPAGGGTVQVVAEGLADPRGGAWGPEETILFAPSNDRIFRVPAAGGPATPVTQLDTSRQEGTHRWPHFLPDGRHFLFTIRGGMIDRRGIYASSLDGNTKKFLVRSELSAVYAPSGHLLYVEGETLMARAFDAGRLEASGSPLTVAERVGGSTLGYAAVSISRSRALAYAGAFDNLGWLTWFDRSGKMLDAVSGEGNYLDFRLSPDQKRLAASLLDRKAGNPDIWVTDLARGSTSRFTSEQSLESMPIWSPNGERIVFRTNRRGVVEFSQKSAAGGGNEEVIYPEEMQRTAHATGNVIATDWSPDGRYVSYTAPTTASRLDLWLLPLTGEKKPIPFLHTPADEIQGNFSPDGRLVAYSSNETGRFEVYVQTLPLSDRKWQISTGGGYEPRWRLGGGELYYLSDDRKLMAVSVGTAAAFEAGAPRTLFQTRVPVGVSPFRTNYVPAGDGQRFLINTQSGVERPTPITVVLNWTPGLKK